MDYIAHIAEDGRVQTVKDHLAMTAELSAMFAKSFNASEEGRLIGLMHDIGKCTEGFQQRLNGGHIVDHASAGALECLKMGAGDQYYWAAWCIAFHHGGLKDREHFRKHRIAG